MHRNRLGKEFVMVQTQPATTAGPPLQLNRPARLLVLTLPAYAAFVALSAAVIAPRVEISSAEMPPEQIAEIAPAWVAITVLWMLPPAIAAIALASIARRLPRTRLTAAVPVLAGAVGLLALGYVVVTLFAWGVQTPTWGDSPLFAAGFVLSLLVGWLGVHPASLLVLGALIRAGIARRTAIVIGAIYALYWAFELLVYVPALLDPGSLADSTIGLPPFLLGIFWAVMGGALLRAGVRSRT